MSATTSPVDWDGAIEIAERVRDRIVERARSMTIEEAARGIHIIAKGRKAFDSRDYAAFTEALREYEAAFPEETT